MDFKCYMHQHILVKKSGISESHQNEIWFFDDEKWSCKDLYYIEYLLYSRFRQTEDPHFKVYM